MNINQLEYFIAAAELLNFTKAAARCYISQTAMTQQIRSLEHTIGVPLFERDSHHVALTAAGRVYLNEARLIVSRSNEALRMARLAAEGTEGELTIGFINGFGQSDFTRILRGFHHSCPGIKLSLLRGNMSVLLDRLQNRECDVVFAVAPSQRSESNLSTRYVHSYPIMAVLPAGHPLSGRQQLTYPELEREEFIMMQPTDRPKDQMEESLLIYQRGGYLPKIAAIEGEQETLMLMIAAGMGIALLPEYIIRPYLGSDDLCAIPMVRRDGSAETYDFEVSWLEDNMNPALDKFLTLLDYQSAWQ